ncbi:MAG: hypothetical protein JNL03_12335 [Prolixibacteraceae bacterium]|nr:hypothetical protein [Prolixibacteraceae bacterium]
MDTMPDEDFKLPPYAIVMTNQANASIVIADASSQKNIWEWNPSMGKIPQERKRWFSNPSEVKPVYNNTCILMTASGGAVALIRIADRKVLFYGYAGVNPHSATLLPDGNIVTASSADGILATFAADTVAGFGEMVAKYELPAAHNVYWDTRRNKLYTATHVMHTYDYNGQKLKPLLNNHTVIDALPNGERFISSHDLYPVDGEEDLLWLTTNDQVWMYDLNDNTAKPIYRFPAIKSISNASCGTIMLCPTEEWWSDHLVNEDGRVVFRAHGFKIYKARWIFSD